MDGKGISLFSFLQIGKTTKYKVSWRKVADLRKPTHWNTIPGGEGREQLIRITFILFFAKSGKIARKLCKLVSEESASLDELFFQGLDLKKLREYSSLDQFLCQARSEEREKTVPLLRRLGLSLFLISLRG